MIRFLFSVLKISLKAAALVVLIAVIVAYARLADTDGIKTALEDRFRKSTGRQLTINGDIGLDLSFPPRLKAENVSLGNPSWASRKNMMTVKKIEADIDLLPLVMGDVAVPTLRFIGIDVLLETNKDGENNWDGLAGFKTAAGPLTDMALTGPLLAAGTIAVAGGVFAVLNSATGSIISLPLPGIDLAFSNLIPGC